MTNNKYIAYMQMGEMSNCTQSKYGGLSVCMKRTCLVDVTAPDLICLGSEEDYILFFRSPVPNHMLIFKCDNHDKDVVFEIVGTVAMFSVPPLCTAKSNLFHVDMIFRAKVRTNGNPCVGSVDLENARVAWNCSKQLRSIEVLPHIVLSMTQMFLPPSSSKSPGIDMVIVVDNILLGLILVFVLSFAVFLSILLRNRRK